MSALIRLVVFLVVIAAIGYAAMFALATFVEPTQDEITVDVKLERPAGP